MIFKNLDQVDTTNIPVVIVGSGPAGITLALELEKNGEIVGDSISGLTHNRLRQFGGTSGHWGGWSRPLEEYNFEKWNIKMRDLEGYSDKTCDILGIKRKFHNANLNKYLNQIEFQYSRV